MSNPIFVNQNAKAMMRILHLCSVLSFVFLSLNLSAQTCPGECPGYTTTVSTDAIPECAENSNFRLDGNIDNNSPCEDSQGLNCWKFVINRGDPGIESISTEIGKGNGCNGQIDNYYSLIDGVCAEYGSTGSQNKETFEFGPSGQITIWVCDNSSGEVSLCALCFNLPSPAPVDLIRFSGEAMENQVKLTWMTENEENNQLFEVQRSTDGANFTNIGMVSGRGTTSDLSDYSFMDEQPLPLAYYRLKQLDFDGNFEYSEIISVKRGDFKSKMKVYPTQVFDEINIQLETFNTKKSILKISSVAGEMMYLETLQGANTSGYRTVDVKDYPPGIYFVAFTNNVETVTQKFVVTKQ